MAIDTSPLGEPRDYDSWQAGYESGLRVGAAEYGERRRRPNRRKGGNFLLFLVWILTTTWLVGAAYAMGRFVVPMPEAPTHLETK